MWSRGWWSWGRGRGMDNWKGLTGKAANLHSPHYRFWVRVEQGANGCWEWQGSLSSSGYGQVKRGGKHFMCHRIAWEDIKGPIPAGYEVDHLCRNRRCVNPQHLECVSHKENCLRGISPWAKNAKKTHCPQGHEYVEENIFRYRNKGRECLTCKRQRAAQLAKTPERKAYMKAYHQKRKAQ